MLKILTVIASITLKSVNKPFIEESCYLTSPKLAAIKLKARGLIRKSNPEGGIDSLKEEDEEVEKVEDVEEEEEEEEEDDDEDEDEDQDHDEEDNNNDNNNYNNDYTNYRNTSI
ncbi:hypothetical protein CC78DRAFT_548975 [Lojkania enalia]|uniref:Uncharacterized protein n=1 Tax=Lojkania enalia TaxID=147567 RepID=A0A9P4N4S2_9PLEO|nr:hypothetical protein CC78DRAFT_548975 [Didymosphaeria enalia]